MGVFLLGLLFVVVIPLAEGVLLALLLREIYMHHPLPLGGTIVPMWWKRSAPAVNAAKSAETEETADEFVYAEPVYGEAAGSEAVAVETNPEIAQTDSPESTLPADSAEEPGESPQPEISVFDGTESIPDNLQVNNVLEAMTSEAPAADLQDFERIIEEASQSGIINPAAIQDVGDEMNVEDLQALAEALPGTKIDFSQELDTDSPVSNPIAPTVEELLGENFDYDALEKQAQQQALRTRQPFTFLAPAGDAGEREPATESAEIVLDVQEDKSGMVQVSNPFIVNTIPKFADFTMPQTILPSFSGDWIQEASGMAESSDGDAEKFCFTEESRPMFVRKKGKKG